MPDLYLNTESYLLDDAVNNPSRGARLTPEEAQAREVIGRRGRSGDGGPPAPRPVLQSSDQDVSSIT